MKAFKAIYTHGHFIDIESKKRLIPVQGAEYTISAEDRAFRTEDVNSDSVDTLSSEDKASWAKDKYGAGKHTRIMSAGALLFFRVGNSSKVPGDESMEYIFVCKLIEDLYLFLQRDKTGVVESDWRLAECKCVLEECILGGMSLSEKVQAKSLNQLFSNTVQFYFSRQRSGSANAFTTFFNYQKDMRITFKEATDGHYPGLSGARAHFVDTRNNQLQNSKNLKHETLLFGEDIEP